jgi:hypothetical protein
MIICNESRQFVMTGVSKVPLIYGRSGVGVDVQIMSPLTSILSLRGERRF